MIRNQGSGRGAEYRPQGRCPDLDLAELPALLPGSIANRTLAGPITGLSYNSKTVKEAELFFCLRGNQVDGHLFAHEAVEAGAAVLVVEAFLPVDIPQVKVPDSRAALARVSRRYFDDPAAHLGLVGVTGTNGKTTTAFYIRSVLERTVPPVGLIGTVYNQMGGEPEPSSLTTPESLDLARLLAQARADGCRWVVMEVSSHALAMGRVDPGDVDIAVVTNVTRDHFEYHQTFEQYLAAKARLVWEMQPGAKAGRPKGAVLNADDPNVAALARDADVPILTFGLERPADVSATAVTVGVAGSRFLLHLPGASPTPVHLPLPGIFNIANALAAAAVGRLAGIDLPAMVAGLEACRHVPGRAEVIDEGQNFHVIVDFAHNPDALRKIVSLRPERPGARTILVFGAEGGKDRGKRPQMGEAARGADYAIITSDNMYKEDPGEVARQIAAGLQGWPHAIILDRGEAIHHALTMAKPGDLVIIAGKGHERTWVYGGRRLPFDDREVARQILRTQLGSARV